MSQLWAELGQISSCSNCHGMGVGGIVISISIVSMKYSNYEDVTPTRSCLVPRDMVPKDAGAPSVLER